MSRAASPDWELLAWDSSHFGFATARIRPDLSPRELADALQAMGRAGVRLGYLCVPIEQAQAQDAALRLGGRRVDRKTTYAGSVAGILGATAPSAQDASIAEAFGPMTESLRELALEAGAFSRFRVDADFPRSGFELLYSRWMERSLQREVAGAVFVALDGQDPSGAVTVGEKGGRAEIGLIAVNARARGQGRARALVRRAALWARDAGLSSAQVTTQGDNLPACRLYESCGYSVESVQAVFHFWLPAAASGSHS